MLHLLLLVIGPALLCAMIWPDLRFSKALVNALAKLACRIGSQASAARALIAISIALCVFAAIWALQGDAPVFLAMLLPEIAGWLATYEIATLVEAAVGLTAAFVALRIGGLNIAIKARRRASRRQRFFRAHRPANDLEDEPLALVA